MDVIPRKSQMLPEQSITSSFEESSGGSSLSMILIAITFWIELSVSFMYVKSSLLIGKFPFGPVTVIDSMAYGNFPGKFFPIMISI